MTEIEPYLKSVAAGELPLKRAFRTNEEERMIREFILQMKLGRVELGYFTEKFGVNIQERFAEQLAGLAEEGLLVVEDGAVQLNRDGLLCVDNLLHDFFLQHHRTNKIV
jgi:oxygen-independent coproporphyrinogen-3 oxidase